MRRRILRKASASFCVNAVGVVYEKERVRSQPQGIVNIVVVRFASRPKKPQ